MRTGTLYTEDDIVVTKDMFIEKVFWKSFLEVLEIAGGPDIIEKSLKGEDRWIYEYCAIDQDQGKDISLVVTIRNGICIRVEDFQLGKEKN